MRSHWAGCSPVFVLSEEGGRGKEGLTSGYVLKAPISTRPAETVLLGSIYRNESVRGREG